MERDKRLSSFVGLANITIGLLALTLVGWRWFLASLQIAAKVAVCSKPRSKNRSRINVTHMMSFPNELERQKRLARTMCAVLDDSEAVDVAAMC